MTFFNFYQKVSPVTRAVKGISYSAKWYRSILIQNNAAKLGAVHSKKSELWYYIRLTLMSVCKTFYILVFLSFVKYFL